MLYDVDQADWGSSKIYADATLDGCWDPTYIIIHWGGLTSERTSDQQAFESLRSWQRYHIGKGWQDIAYNYAITELGTICRLRGENHGGHASGTDPATGEPWSTVGVGVVWVGGLRDQDGPSPAARSAMHQFCDSRGLPVLGHRDTGKSTQCPGEDWLDWAHHYEPEGEDMQFGDQSEDVAKWQDYLNLWTATYAPGNTPVPVTGIYESMTANRTESFQRWADLTVDGTRATPMTIAALTMVLVPGY